MSTPIDPQVLLAQIVRNTSETDALLPTESQGRNGQLICLNGDNSKCYVAWFEEPASWVDTADLEQAI
jgi:hypothetical protein